MRKAIAASAPSAPGREVATILAWERSRDKGAMFATPIDAQEVMPTLSRGSHAKSGRGGKASAASLAAPARITPARGGKVSPPGAPRRTPLAAARRHPRRPHEEPARGLVLPKKG